MQCYLFPCETQKTCPDISQAPFKGPVCGRRPEGLKALSSLSLSFVMYFCTVQFHLSHSVFNGSQIHRFKASC